MNSLVAKSKSILWLFLFLFFSLNTVKSQTGTITVTGGGVQLFVTSLSQYNDGVSLVNWTKVSIEYTNTGVLNWQLVVKSNYPSIMSDGSNPDLNLNYIEIVPVGIVNTNTTYSVNGSFSLTDVGDVLIDGTGTDNFEISFGITYNFGINPPPSLINVPWGFYYTDLLFSLEYF